MAYVPEYYKQPDVPWCILGKVTWGVLTAVKVPEDRAAEYVTKYGFKVIIADSEFPVPIDDRGTMPEILRCSSVQANPRRHAYRSDLDVTPEGHEDWPDRESD
jgi:hypothetical protein